MFPFVHTCSCEPAPHHLHGLTNRLGWLISFWLPRTEVNSLSCVLLCSVLFPLKCHEQMKVGEGGELLTAKLLIVHINNEATEMLNKSELIEANPWRFEVKSGGILCNEMGCSVDAWNQFRTWVNPILVCSVDYAFPNGANCWTNYAIILCSIFDQLYLRKVPKVPIMLPRGTNYTSKSTNYASERYQLCLQKNQLCFYKYQLCFKFN